VATRCSAAPCSQSWSRAARTLLAGGRHHELLSLALASDDATAAGLTCGGTVHVLLQRLDVIPKALWDSFADGRSVALATPLDETLAPIVVHPGGQLDGTLGNSGLDTTVQSEADALLERPGTAVHRITAGDLDVVIEAGIRRLGSSSSAAPTLRSPSNAKPSCSDGTPRR
jgi:xanthine/CO dehydrogenase XdhC/CoxF family maturation factor